MNRTITTKQWRALLEVNWATRPEHGQLLEADGVLVGFCGVVVADRNIGGRCETFCNITSWCVLPAYRGKGVAVSLQVPYLQRHDWTITVFSPLPYHERHYRRHGCVTLDTAKLVFPAFWNPGTLRLGGRVLTDPGRISEQIDPEDRQLLEDHVPRGCGVALAIDGRDYTLMIVKRRIKRRVPIVEILYLSNPRLAAARFERMKLALLRSQRAVALVADSRLLDATKLRHLRLPYLTIYRSSHLTSHQIDGLYSELAVLPI